MTGRPSKRTPEIVAAILNELPFLDGGLEELCSRDDMPGERTVYTWLADDPEFQQAYVRARELAGDVQFARGLRDALGAQDAQLGRLVLDARKWAASKLAPKKYGDKLDLTTGGDKLSSQSDSDVAARMAAILAVGAARKAGGDS